MCIRDSGLGVLTDVQSLTPTYQPAPGETGEIEFVLTVQAQSPCTTPVIDSKILRYVAQATVEAGDNFEVCQADGAFTISSANADNYQSLTWSIITGTGSLTNQDNISPTYSPSNLDWINGQVTLRLTATSGPGCVDSSDDVIVTLTPSPVVDAGENISICNNSVYLSLIHISEPTRPY